MVSYDFTLKNKIIYLENSHHMWTISPCISSPNKISFNWFSLKSHVCLTPVHLVLDKPAQNFWLTQWDRVHL